MEILRAIAPSASGGGRALTPLKADNRSGTPSRFTSGPRSSSAPKGSSFRAAVLEAASFSNKSSRYLSVRKERRRINSNLISSHAAMHANISLEDDSSSFSEMNPQSCCIDNHRSNFQFVLNNIEARTLFLSCQTREDFPSRSSKPASKCTINYDSKSAECRALDAWRRVERRLRVVVERIISSPQMSAFVFGVEEALEHFLVSKSVLSLDNASPGLASVLVLPLRVSTGGSLHFALKDSPLHRLLLHAVCQYHGFSSKVIMSFDSFMIMAYFRICSFIIIMMSFRVKM